ncbi:MAG TPA: class I SAM-dependent methyltransferase [Planctomycetota bacterium]|nr:class I SAM-dependent methyltransferase [Planctomycetota bacterium]
MSEQKAPVWDDSMPQNPEMSFVDYVLPGMMGPKGRFEQWAGIDWLPGETGWSVLDVGCGDANYCRFFREAKGMVYSGCDISQNMLAAARKAYPDVDFRQADATALPYEDSSYDMVFCSDLLLHIPLELEAPIVGELRRVARHVAVVHTRPLIEAPPHEHLRRPAPHLRFRYQTLDYELAFMRSMQADVEQHIRNYREIIGRPGVDAFFIFRSPQ